MYVQWTYMYMCIRTYFRSLTFYILHCTCTLYIHVPVYIMYMPLHRRQNRDTISIFIFLISSFIISTQLLGLLSSQFLVRVPSRLTFARPDFFPKNIYGQSSIMMYVVLFLLYLNSESIFIIIYIKNCR